MRLWPRTVVAWQSTWGGRMRKLFLSPSAALCALAFTLGPIGFTASVRAEEDGDRLFRTTCGICHTIQSGQNRLGPSLAGIVGRKAGTVPGFNYSDANKNSNVVWDEAQLDQYLTDPKQLMPGTKRSSGNKRALWGISIRLDSVIPLAV